MSRWAPVDQTGRPTKTKEDPLKQAKELRKEMREIDFEGIYLSKTESHYQSLTEFEQWDRAALLFKGAIDLKSPHKLYSNPLDHPNLVWFDIWTELMRRYLGRSSRSLAAYASMSFKRREFYNSAQDVEKRHIDFELQKWEEEKEFNPSTDAETRNIFPAMLGPGSKLKAIYYEHGQDEITYCGSGPEGRDRGIIWFNQSSVCPLVIKEEGLGALKEVSENYDQNEIKIADSKDGEHRIYWEWVEEPARSK